MACTSGCPTQDCESYAACLKRKNVSTQWLGGTGPSQSEQKRWDRENQAYRSAVKDGLKPRSVSFGAVNKAYEEASK